jgi:hypothetical protein
MPRVILEIVNILFYPYWMVGFRSRFSTSYCLCILVYTFYSEFWATESFIRNVRKLNVFCIALLLLYYRHFTSYQIMIIIYSKSCMLLILLIVIMIRTNSCCCNRSELVKYWCMLATTEDCSINQLNYIVRTYNVQQNIMMQYERRIFEYNLMK